MKKKKKNIYLSFMMLALFSLGSFAQQSKGLWFKITQEKITSDVLTRTSMPIDAEYYQLNIEALKGQLETVPERQSGIKSNTILDFPNADGSLESFRVMEASIMASELQAEYPEIRSYVGQSIENPSSLIRFSLTPLGLHTMTLSENGTQLIDPYTNDGFYMVYKKTSLPNSENILECGVNDDIEYLENINSRLENSFQRDANDGQMRTYRLALGSSREYTNFHGGTVAGALAAMVVSMTRVNGVYERELSITMEIIADNDDLISTNINSIFINSANVINTSTGTMNGIVGSGSYDIGHVFTTGSGGVAFLGSVCTSSKGGGTTGLSSPVGDFFDIDFVAHEIGHQFGATHTFNGSSANCAGGNRSPSTAYEPGSGSTIMAYAGICPPQNVQSNSNDYFHQASIDQIWTFVTLDDGDDCDSTSPSGNSAPTADAGANYSIPIRTPYKLTGSSTDPDGTTSHTYCWEQYDLGPAGLPSNTSPTGPLVRSFSPTTSPTRYVPRLEDVVSNGGNSTTWEVLTLLARPINFRLTVRDNDAAGGQTDSDLMTINTVQSGFFTVTSQNVPGITYDGNSTQTVTWNVAGTNANGINAAEMRILLSTDGGVTFDTVLAANTPNDGSHDVQLPNVDSANCRIIVEAVGNIFYNINLSEFEIEAQLSVEDNFLTNLNIYPNPNKGEFTITFDSFTNDDVTLDIYDIRGRYVYSNTITNNGTINEQISLASAQSGLYLVRLSSSNKSITKKLIIN
ncbi:M12 family metallo-peptidase [Ichthyenterobacterium sp. W332]|uniref:M12 family metallo-peptidase n=1 Tax=Microcosmobacter mediterraneus TaxID=3075607 RepID=A0ABU2YIC6_9FLAO|nr:zinc-dependent metalloprotease family protein [Ichthyenterobacterium sp. W332]MDT0557931.1 M12 family metallo-peptidase [Ichthyenterobacterium sp. W332]